MFADERKGNTAKKRADENRRRRLLLKEQQAKKTSGVTKLETVGVKAAASLPQVSGPISALEKADLARKERASETKQQNAATTIQSRARSIRARKDFRNYIRKNLASSLQEMVRRITDEKKSGRKAQVSTNEFQLLMSQLWIVTSRFRSGSARSVQLEPQSYPVLALLLSCAVNVGIDSSDGSKGVLTPLVETKQGIYRLCALLRLWLVALLDVNSPDVLLSNCFLFWKAAILGDPNKLQRVMRKVLFSESRVTVARQARATGNSEISSTIPLDLIANFRYFMLFQIAGPNPIPSDAESSREACIPTARRQRCGKIWYQIHSTIASEKEQSVRETLSLRCAIELWTVPLLTWKLSTDTISRIVTSSDGQIPFLTSLTSLIRYHGGALSAGKVSMVLEGSDLPVTVCPATAVQCMLANFVQICKVAPSLNGMSPQVFDYAGSIQLWNLLTCLILAAPEATFTSRESSVAWVNVDGRQQPIVLSRVITEQCRGIFVDSFLRRVWQLVLDPLVLKTQDVLGVKSTEDIKLEDDFKKSSAASAILMAAQEAHKDRSQSFWKSSKWAKNLSGKVTGLLGNAKKPQPSSLPNTSSIAHKLASGKGSKRALSRWGGMTPDFNERVSAKPETFVVSFLNTLGFSTSFLMQSWGLLQQNDQLSKLISSLLGRTNMAVASIKVEIRFDDDVEIHDLGKPLPLHQLRRVVVVLRKILHKVYCADIELKGGSTDQFGSSFIATSAQTMKDLYDRSSRRPWCAPKLWLVPDLMEKEISACRTHADYVDVLNLPVFRFCPFLVSFKRRLKLFEQIVTKLRVELQGESSANPFHSNPLKGGIPIRITRGRILEDGLATMNKLGPNMRQRLSIQYYNEAGARESGIDAGGLFKEFWTDLCAIAYNPDYALFSVTDGAGNCLYPNPLSASVHGSDSIVLFSFLGRILGKAMFEGISISPQFAHFFLSYMRGDYNFLHMLADLSTVDPQLYNNLMFLKTYDGDAADLCLTFTVASDSFGGKTEVPLVHGGESVEVTNSNKTRYVELVAKHYVVDRVKEQSQAFTTGLWEVINKEWLQIFNEPELQVLISGATDGDIDVKDMRAHTRYAGGFTGIDRTVNRFWKVVESMDRNQQAALLRFVTSCERPPPLGFGSLNPPFTIQRVGILRDGEKLPSASTCFNVLKLPTYSSEKVMKERLVYAIESGAGFELS